MKTRIFISSVQSEFAVERQALHDYILADALLGRFFDPFLFERLPASDQRADELYLREVEQCSVYLGLLGKRYGSEDGEGVSPTEREFDHASRHHKTRLIFLSGHASEEREQKQQVFARKVQSSLIRKRFSTSEELKSAVYASLVQYLIDKELIRTGPFDASLHTREGVEEVDGRKIREFVRTARSKRGFPLQETAPMEDILGHLNLIRDGRLTHAALLLFGRHPQRMFIQSEVRCVAYHGTVVEKPIPSYKVFKGDVFELVDQAVEFVMARLDFRIGTRALHTSIPGEYEVPRDMIAEAVVNAIAHRDYTSTGSVQVMVFRDRVEVHNPGHLPMGWTVDTLKKMHTSVPANPLLAEPMYLKGYIERLGTGTADIVRLAREKGLREPEFLQDEGFRVIMYRPPSTPQAPPKYPPSGLDSPEHGFEAHEQTPSTQVEEPTKMPEAGEEVRMLVAVVEGEHSRKELQKRLGLKDRKHFRETYLMPALESGFMEMKYPNSPTHSRQMYSLTEKGLRLQEAIRNHSTD